MKKFTFVKIALAALLGVVMLSSCKELSLSETKLNYSAWDETNSFVVKTDLNWEFVEQPDWVRTKKIEENGRTTVEVTTDKNHSFDSRSGKIKIQTAEKYYIVDIIQDGVHKEQESGDLELSVEWGTCNMGATNSYEYGKFYTWDEIHNYESNGYRLPKAEEQRELLEKCVHAWDENNGVNGMWFVAKNGNAVFLPAAGYRGGSDVYYVGSLGFYWSASASNGNAYYLDFSSAGAFRGSSNRYYGRSVRLVRGL